MFLFGQTCIIIRLFESVTSAFTTARRAQLPRRWAKNTRVEFKTERRRRACSVGAKNNGFKALKSQYITYANAFSARAKDNEKWRKREYAGPSLSLYLFPSLFLSPPFGSRLAIHPYLDTHGGDGQRAPKVRLNVVCTSRVALVFAVCSGIVPIPSLAKRTAKMKFDSAAP